MASPNSRQTLIDYCLRRLGEPVVEINVDEEQIEDKVDDALQLYQEYHSDSTVRTYVKHVVTEDDIANRYIPVDTSVLYVSNMFPMSASYAQNSMFDYRYQMYLNNMGDFISFAGDLNYLYQMKQYLGMVDNIIHGQPMVNFSRHQDRLYIYGEWDTEIVLGDYLVYEAYKIIDPQVSTSVYNDMFIKNYTTALIKQQWGLNMSKFEGMQLPGGVTVNGRQIYDDATTELTQLEEKMRIEQELPPDFFIG